MLFRQQSSRLEEQKLPFFVLGFTFVGFVVACRALRKGKGKNELFCINQPTDEESKACAL